MIPGSCSSPMATLTLNAAARDGHGHNRPIPGTRPITGGRRSLRIFSRRTRRSDFDRAANDAAMRASTLPPAPRCGSSRGRAHRDAGSAMPGAGTWPHGFNARWSTGPVVAGESDSPWTKIDRRGRRMRAMFGHAPVGDKVRLARHRVDPSSIEADHVRTYGEEVKFGGGKVIRDVHVFGQSQRSPALLSGAVDTVITNALIALTAWGIDHRLTSASGTAASRRFRPRPVTPISNPAVRHRHRARKFRLRAAGSIGLPADGDAPGDRDGQACRRRALFRRSRCDAFGLSEYAGRH